MTSFRLSIPAWVLLAVVAAVAAAPAANAATITVNSTADDQDPNDGECTFREALVAANSNAVSGVSAGECAAGEAAPTRDLVQFAIPGTGLKSIALTSALPIITGPIHIDGYTQAGASRNTMNDIGVTDAQLRVELNGAGIGAEEPGLSIHAGASGTAVTPTILEGLVINRVNFPACCADSGIFVAANVRHLSIRGNFVGVTADGATTTGFGNGSRAVFLQLNDVSSPHFITIGGPEPGDRNILSGAGGSGVGISGGNTVSVQGNLIGTGRTGTLVSGTSEGVQVSGGSTQVTIRDNLVAGNIQGIHLRGVSDSLVDGNRIGVSATGTALGNGVGIVLEDINVPTIDNVISGNWIAFNGEDGVRVVRNTVDAHGNQVTQNRIHDNGGLGIDLGDDGVTANDGAPDADVGPNGLQDFPVLSVLSADGSDVEIAWTLDSTPSTLHQLEFFHSPTCDPTGHGEGWTYLGQSQGNTDVNGALVSTAFLATSETTGWITATATALSGPLAGSTSEFSLCAPMPGNGGGAGTLQLGAASFVGTEGGVLVIPVTRAGGSAGAASATCTTTPGTADAADYSVVSGSVAWADGESATRDCTVQLVLDGVAEGTETFGVALTGVAGATAGAPAAATVTIQDAALVPAEIPTLGEWSLLLLALGLGLLGLGRLRGA